MYLDWIPDCMHSSRYLIRGIQHSDEWLHAYMRRIGWTDPELSFEALRAALVIVRDRLPPAKAIRLSHRLPVLLRGVFFEDWNYDPGERDAVVNVANDVEERAVRELRRHCRVEPAASADGEPDPELLIEGLLDVLAERVNRRDFDPQYL